MDNHRVAAHVRKVFEALSSGTDPPGEFVACAKGFELRDFVVERFVDTGGLAQRHGDRRGASEAQLRLRVAWDGAWAGGPPVFVEGLVGVVGAEDRPGGGHGA